MCNVSLQTRHVSQFKFCHWLMHRMHSVLPDSLGYKGFAWKAEKLATPALSSSLHTQHPRFSIQSGNSHILHVTPTPKDVVSSFWA